MAETIASIIKWHEETFPDATLEGQEKKFMEEMEEFDASGKIDVMELADMFIVACGLCRFGLDSCIIAFKRVESKMCYNGFLPEELNAAINKKMAVNRSRSWEKKGGLYKHKEL